MGQPHSHPSRPSCCCCCCLCKNISWRCLVRWSIICLLFVVGNNFLVMLAFGQVWFLASKKMQQQQQRTLLSDLQITNNVTCHAKQKLYKDKLTKLEQDILLSIQSNNNTNHTSSQHLQRQRWRRQHAVIVPYRDRAFHLKHFMEYMGDYFTRHFPLHNSSSNNNNDQFSLWIVEQDNDDYFNRGFLTNVALQEIILMDRSAAATSNNDTTTTTTQCVIQHDVDVVPGYFSVVPYNECTSPIHLSSEAQHHAWRTPYTEFVGTVMSMHLQHWQYINGMSNAYKGWGGEDDDLFRRLLFRGLLNCSVVPPQPTRPAPGHGIFQTINQDQAYHTRGIVNVSNNPFEILDQYDWHGVDLSEVDGLSYVRYNVTSHNIMHNQNGFVKVHHIKVVPDYESSLADVQKII